MLKERNRYNELDEQADANNESKKKLLEDPEENEEDFKIIADITKTFVNNIANAE